MACRWVQRSVSDGWHHLLWAREERRMNAALSSRGEALLAGGGRAMVGPCEGGQGATSLAMWSVERSWRAWVDRTLAECEVMQRVEHVVERRQYNGIMLGWRCLLGTSREAEARRHMRGLAELWQLRTLAAAHRTWAAAAATYRLNAARAARAVLHQLATSLRGLRGRAAATVEKYRQHAAVAWMERSVAKGWRTWRLLLDERHAARVLAGHAVTTWMSKELAARLCAWMTAAAAQKRWLRSMVLGGQQRKMAAWRSCSVSSELGRISGRSRGRGERMRISPRLVGRQGWADRI